MLAAAGTLFALARLQTEAIVHFADFGVFWTAAWFPDPYDARALTAAQQWMLPANPLLRPFAYPPSGLLMFKPLGLLDYPIALAVWSLGGLAAFVAAASLYGRRAAALALACPLVALALSAGQFSLFIAAALAAGVRLLPARAAVAGLLLGMLAAVKPQAAILVPVALAAGGHWRALAWAAAAGAAVLLASLSLGPHLWLDWWRSLPGFAHEALSDTYRRMNWGLGPWLAPAGAAIVWIVFRRSRDAATRLVALAAGTALCLPYMMNYDLAAMAPGAAALLTGRAWRGWIVGFFGFVTIWFSPAIIAIGALLISLKASDRPLLPARCRYWPIQAK